ncbi:cellulose synthase/poly-beta-1,6-N-acetylglucosamine synthase-like glycosyltransferase [Dyadobacter jejuensis]|uniref:Cellulose synthase/poly-beta-1,6-N-acetylglucosamine synthase-like glycosyltransferase n=1 Tax=Dyadobacter jejuensis TaxID=1082580 RepID=A0A316AAM2_9BACT|nr:glycosyltransferase [Dyadobacter jejuensis]PWJ54248.1 cellulose synthase/poly-beta-1,6-N-acetylglucosamine synthase-like glycosyltransferase [Dyadobacter jejuensis]
MESVKVSILLAARNEEDNMLRCLQALDALDYPTHRLEICIGDDASSDATAAITKAFIRDKAQFKYFRIDQALPSLEGKANVLAQLAQQAQGEYFLFCDADIAVQPGWCQAMLAGFSPQAGVVVGVTRMKKGNFLVDFLSLEWLFALFVMHLAALCGVAITGLGNNMGVSRRAYESVGGYDRIGFSVVEDYALFRAIVDRGFGFSMLFQPSILSSSIPPASFLEWKRQRIRWIRGVKDASWLLQATILVVALSFPVLLLWALVTPIVGGLFFLLHYTIFTSFAAVGVFRMRQMDLVRLVPFFWGYSLISLSLMVLYYFRSDTIAWKGREFA